MPKRQDKAKQHNRKTNNTTQLAQKQSFFKEKLAASATDVTAWTVDKVKESAEEQWPGGEVAEKLEGTAYHLCACVYVCTRRIHL